LANFVKTPEQVITKEEAFHEYLFGEKSYSECVIGYLDGVPVGMALFFTKFSTWTGTGLYLDDLYVEPEHRNKGIGKLFLAYLANECVIRKFLRFEWWLLDWNENAIVFYKKLGAVPMCEWTVFRLEGEQLNSLANKYI